MEPEQKVYCEASDWAEVWSEDWSDPELPNWIKFNPSWLGREECWFNPANATTGTSVRDDGTTEHYASLRTYAQQPACEDRFYDKKRCTLKYGTAFLRSQIQFRYGRLEAEVQPSSTAVASAFWLVRDGRFNLNVHYSLPRLVSTNIFSLFLLHTAFVCCAAFSQTKNSGTLRGISR